MRELTYFIASTLDGYIADPSGGDPDPTVEFVSTDPVAKVRELTQEGGLGIWLCGGGGLAETLWPEIDRLIVKVNPVVIGAGIKLFDGADFAVRRLSLTDHQVYKSGVAVLTFRKG